MQISPFAIRSIEVVILIFTSGKLVCTGANREEAVYRAVEKLHEKLEEEQLIYHE